MVEWLEQYDKPEYILTFSVEKVYRSSLKWTKALIQRSANVVEQDKDIKVVRKFEDGFAIVELITEQAYQYEGREMGHCVASYAGKKESVIYSLRDPLNKPHGTLEVCRRQNRCIQVKGKQNRFVISKYASYILTFINEASFSLDERTLENFGLSKIDNEYLKKLKNYYQEKIPVTLINNKAYINHSDPFWHK